MFTEINAQQHICNIIAKLLEIVEMQVLLSLYGSIYHYQVIFNDLRPNQWSCIPDEIHRLILACTDRRPDHDVSIEEIITSLEHFEATRTSVGEYAMHPHGPPPTRTYVTTKQIRIVCSK
jgi:hypothetical protein